MAKPEDINTIDFDNDEVKPGDTICVHDFLTNSWKTATVEEIDNSDREILVNFDNGPQEWINIDGRKICFPSALEQITETPARRASASGSKKRSNSSRSSKKNAKKAKKSTAKESTEKNTTVNEEDFELAVRRVRRAAAEDGSKATNNKETKKTEVKPPAAFPKLKLKPVSRFEMMRRKREQETNRRRKQSGDVAKNNVQTVESTNTSRRAANKPVTKTISKKKTGGEITKIKIKFGNPPALTESVTKKKGNTPDIPPLTVALSGSPKLDSDLVLSPAVTPGTPFTPLTPGSSIVNISQLGLLKGATDFICPKQECKKQFRNENLLMMHIKHYHREYKSLLSSIPNVADLAYARTVGESIDSPRSTPVKKGTPCTPSSPSSSVLLAQLKKPPLVPPPISIQSEHKDAELSVTQNNPVTLLSPKVSDKLDRCIGKPSPLREADDKVFKKKSSIAKKKFLSQMEQGEVTNCVCGYGFEDGLMMQCDLCLCWQHAVCNSVEKPEDTPPDYICYTCQHPRRQHTTNKYSYVQNWLKDGRLPRFEFTKVNEEVEKQREVFLKQTQKLLCDLTDLKNAVRSLQLKVHILKQTPDHPKLYLWAMSWDDKKCEEKENQKVSEDGPVPEVAINMADCRKHLQEHIDEEMEKVDLILQSLEEKVDNLDNDTDFGDEPDKYKSVVKQTLLMLTRDLASIQNIKYSS